MRHIICLVCLLLLSGCATKSTFNDEKMPRLTDEWQTTRAIIKAADASGNFAVAMNAAAQEVEKHPENSEARIILSRLQTLEGRPRLALETLAPLLGVEAPAQTEGNKAVPQSKVSASLNAELLLEQGRAYLALKERMQASSLLEQCLAAEPGAHTRREARKLMAVAHDEDGRHAEAQSIYMELLSERDEVSVRYNYGRSLLAAKDYGRSAAILMPLVDMADLPQARLVAAAALANNGEAKAARSLLQGYMPDSDIERILKAKRR